MRDAYLQAKRCLLLFTAVLIALMLSSCIIIVYEEEPITLDAQKYLEANFSGSFTDGREITIDNSLYDSYSYHNRLFRFYSSALRQDVSVLAQPFYDKSKITGYYYTTNYLFLKYAKDITESAEKMIASDFSDIKVLFDFNWMFSADDENDYSNENFKDSFLIYNSNKIHNSPKFILIHATNEELSDLENRIKSVIFTFRFETSASPELQFFITSPESEALNHIDFSSVTIDNLLDKQYCSKFYKCYICNDSYIDYELPD